MICAGIDAGSRTIKSVIFDTDKLQMLASGTADQGIQQEDLARELYENVLKDAGVSGSDVSSVVATGYGRHGIGLATKVITEITCHARGVRYLVPKAQTVIDIGGQDSKLIRMAEDGAVQDFAMNDRCAAGTGCFLEVVSRRLDIPLPNLGKAAEGSTHPAAISSTCVVFAETEIIGLLASGTPCEDIVAGIQRAIANRVATMAGRSIETPLVFTGGVALVPGMRDALESVLGVDVTVCPTPQITGALGAALSG